MDVMMVLAWLYDLLTTDPELAAGVTGGWQETPIEGTASPWGTVESIGQRGDLRGAMGGELIWARPTIRITLWDRFENYSRIKALAKRVDDLVCGQYSIDTSDGVIYSAVREFTEVQAEPVGAEEVRHIMQQYGFEAKAD